MEKQIVIYSYMDYYAARKRSHNGLLSSKKKEEATANHATQMNFKSIMLSVRSQTEKIVSFHLQATLLKRKKTRRAKKSIVIVSRSEAGGRKLSAEK